MSLLHSPSFRSNSLECPLHLLCSSSFPVSNSPAFASILPLVLHALFPSPFTFCQNLLLLKPSAKISFYCQGSPSAVICTISCLKFSSDRYFGTKAWLTMGVLQTMTCLLNSSRWRVKNILCQRGINTALQVKFLGRRRRPYIVFRFRSSYGFMFVYIYIYISVILQMAALTSFFTKL